MRGKDIRIRRYPLPSSIKAQTVYLNGYYTILVNENLSEDAQLREYQHELDHINSEDFQREESADQIETEAHNE